MSQFWSQRVQELDPYVPGEQPKNQQYVKLNTNESPYPPSPLAIAAMLEGVSDTLRLYPDPNADDLKQSIADFYSVDKACVFVGNGSDEVLAHAFVGLLKQSKPLLYPDISYSFYPVYCKLFGIDAVKVPLTDNFEIDPKDYQQENGAIIFPNPNAPTGMALALDTIEQILKDNPSSVVLVDEAYVDFGAETAISLIGQYPNLLVVQTLSKSRALAGIRVGFAVGSPELIDGLERVKNSFNSYPLGRVEQLGATAAMKDREYFDESRQKIMTTREQTTSTLVGLGYTVLPSSSNFIFAKPPEGQSAEKIYLSLKEQGVLVRYFNKPRISEYLRITIGTDDEMSVLFDRLKTV
ncbi:histidinol-phosphate transaminase [Leucothrix arctica]|uniref:Histidinol-phosphate aminotransferase n=1 Tax=Leucothrix arctica TaxID=1481894 RepID=A0A317C6F1_9GAMM|nr:histidinol-phosphate transaminase [Leucothrix arctica]PWQ92983.1 histidinol-phosphate transaminase [Leucothrix arctica]